MSSNRLMRLSRGDQRNGRSRGAKLIRNHGLSLPVLDKISDLSNFVFVQFTILAFCFFHAVRLSQAVA